ncbi:MAG: ATP-binding cassette domain-containing protein [Candidatus Firestonebacteria bacterium]
MIDVAKLSKFYGPTRAVENVTFTAEKGEILGLLGPNGAGKTTIMRMLTGYFAPTSGKARIAGFDIVEEPLEVKKRIGYLPEILPLYHEMVVTNYLEFIAELKGVPFKERKLRVAKVLEMARIEDVKHRIIGRLSRGYKQRVGLAQALIHDPEVLILDEPTIGLDPKQIIEIRQLIKQLGGTRTVILSSHILPEVSMTCEKIVIIDKGSVVAVDDQAGLSAKLAGNSRIILKIKGDPAKATARFEKIKDVKGVFGEKKDGLTSLTFECAKGKDVREDIFHAVVDSGLVIYEMKTATMSLEDVFLKLTTKEEGV